MSKKVIFICVLALVGTLALPAYAAVQNVKISGDVTVRSLVRENYDLDKNDAKSTGATPDNNSDAYFMHSVGINLSADLTDKVGVMTRIVNQRDWDNNSSGSATFDVDVDLAYVALKEFFFAPLTVTAGRQNLWYGRGLIVGKKLLDFNAAISANEYTETYGFDAVRAVFDLSPWTMDFAYAKMAENAIYNAKDDVDLYVANIGRKFDQNNAEAEAYAIAKIDNGVQIKGYPDDATTLSSVGQNTVYTLGARGSMDLPTTINVLKNINLAAEIAHQTGTYNQSTAADKKAYDRNRDAWAVDLNGSKAFPDVMWTPKLNLEYVLFTGENSYSDTDKGKWNAWDPVYRGSVYTPIREFQNYFYATRFRADNVSLTEIDMDSGLTNTRQVMLTGVINPLKKLALSGTYTKFWLDERLLDSLRHEKKSADMGQELDCVATYNYSNDVSISLLYANFFPGKYWDPGQKDTATDLVGSVKLTF